MKSLVAYVVVLAAAVAVGACQSASAVRPQTDLFTLDNGIRVVVFYVPESPNVAIFTFLPMGLASDAAGRTQWSHLIEHLVVRSTVPAGSAEGNAETLPDHMRLDFYGTVDNWQEGLAQHVRWLEGVPFTEENLQAEKVAVNRECDVTARLFAAHKFAVAAWAQGCRHGLTHAAVKGDVERAMLEEVQKWRDEHLVVLDRTVVCIVGGLDRKTIEPIVREKLGAIRSEAKLVEPVELNAVSRDMTWDLNARHLLLTWPIPGPDDEAHAPLMAAAEWLNSRLFSDQELRKLAGTVVVGADLALPEGHFFCVSATLRPETSFADVQAKLDEHLDALRAGGAEAGMMAARARMLAIGLTTPTDPAEIKAYSPEHITLAMIEGNLGLQWGMQEFRYGALRATLAEQLSKLTGDAIPEAARKYLAKDKCAVCTLVPGPVEKQAGPTSEGSE
jgi:zinc protease